jgi:hypothetical protein
MPAGTPKKTAKRRSLSKLNSETSSHVEVDVDLGESDTRTDESIDEPNSHQR